MNANASSALRAKLHELLGGFSNAMLVTFATDGGLHARPMAIAEVDPSNVLWFVSSRESLKTTEIEHDSRAHIICQSNNTFLSISGEAILTDNRMRIAELWRERFRNWFPKGPYDENLVLIAVRPTTAEYWDDQGVNQLAYLRDDKAYSTGETPGVAETEEHAVVH